jgi:hypothetical protein
MFLEVLVEREVIYEQLNYMRICHSAESLTKYNVIKLLMSIRSTEICTLLTS